MLISGKSRIIGLFGHPVEHTLSPYMQNAAFSHCGLDYCYFPFSVQPDHLRNAIAAIRSLNFCGVNLTIPHKEGGLSVDQIADSLPGLQEFGIKREGIAISQPQRGGIDNDIIFR